jgi:transposase
MAKTPIAVLLRIGWASVGRIVERLVAEHLDEHRLSGLVAIGVDEISYRRGQRYLTSVVDHATGRGECRRNCVGLIEEERHGYQDTEFSRAV